MSNLHRIRSQWDSLLVQKRRLKNDKIFWPTQQTSHTVQFFWKLEKASSFPWLLCRLYRTKNGLFRAFDSKPWWSSLSKHIYWAAWTIDPSFPLCPWERLPIRAWVHLHFRWALTCYLWWRHKTVFRGTSFQWDEQLLRARLIRSLLQRKLIGQALHRRLLDQVDTAHRARPLVADLLASDHLCWACLLQKPNQVWICAARQAWLSLWGPNDEI